LQKFADNLQQELVSAHALILNMTPFFNTLHLELGSGSPLTPKQLAHTHTPSTPLLSNTSQVSKTNIE